MPGDYRRVLGLVNHCGHKAVIQAQLARFPEEVVEGWLAEFEALNLIAAGAAPRARFPRLARKPKSLPQDEAEQRRIAHATDYADISLSRLGVYVSLERAGSRRPLLKSPRDTQALVVDDDPDQLALAVLRLTAAGFPARTADCVKRLFSSLRERVPDILFLDVMLPDGDGFEVLDALRNHPAYALVPIVMLTAKTAPGDVAKGLALGADAYITKPYGRNTLEYVLRYSLNMPLPLAPAAAATPGRAAPGPTARPSR